MAETNAAIKTQSLLSLDIPSDEREWFFGFCENIHELPWWQRWITRKDPIGIRHCYAFCQMGNCILTIEPHRDRIDINIQYPTADEPYLCVEEAALGLTAAGHFIVKHKYKPSIRGIKSSFNFIPTCVTVVKCATGFASLAVTPKKLLHELLAQGAHLYIKEESK